MLCSPSEHTQRCSASAYAAGLYAYEAMFGVAAATLLLLFIGIHNAWDAVTYHVFVKRRGTRRRSAWLSRPLDIRKSHFLPSEIVSRMA